MPRFRPIAASALTALLALISASCGSSGPTTITVTPSTPALDDGDSIVLTASINGGKSNKPVTWTLNGPGSLANSTFPSATYTAPNILPSLAPEQVPITVSLTSNPAVSATVTVTVNPRPGINTQALPAATVGQPYSTVIPVAGGTAPFQWSIYNGPIETGYKVGGALPDGLSLDPTSGTVSGTPTGGGTWYFEAIAQDADNNLAFGGFLSIQVNPAATTASPIPLLNQPLRPTTVAPGGPSFTLQVSGTGFVSGATINYNGAPLATTLIDASHVAATVPAANIATAGTASITVTNPGAKAVRSNVVYFPVATTHTDVIFNSVPNTFQFYIPSGIVAADFNEDGKTDLALSFTGDEAVLLGNNDGTFTSAPGSPQRLVSPPYDDFGSPYAGSIVAGDFNHSGHIGLVVDLLQNEAANVFLGNGDGSMSLSSANLANAEGDSTNAMAVADVNGDGNLDLAFASQGGGQSPIDLGYGVGAFTPVGDINFNGGLLFGIAFGDFNGDGKIDVVTTSLGDANYPIAGYTVALGNGDGTFALAPGSPVFLGSSIVGVAVGDFNGDGKLDLALLDYDSNNVIVLLGNGDGSFGMPVYFPTGQAPYAIVAADFNNDGNLDLAIANTGSNTVTLLLGDGHGAFSEAPSSPYQVGKDPSALAAADFNNDGKLDLAVANSTSGTITILLQQ